jgi:protein SCO1
MKDRIVFLQVFISLALALTMAGCNGSLSPAKAPQQRHDEASSGALTQTQTYKLVGVVEKVDVKAGEVTIKHEAIPGFMGAMTMPFAVADGSLLADVRAGDEVEGLLRVGRNHSAIEKLDVTRPAPAQSLQVELSGGGARVTPRPAELAPGQEVPDFTMTTQEGKTLRLSDLRGRVVLLTFIYTRCPLPDFCPLIDRKFRELAGKLGAVRQRAMQVRLVSVSFDPEHDTPLVLARHAQSQGAVPPLWTFAVAAHEELRKVAPGLGLTYLPGENEIIHSLSTAIIDERGRLVRLERGTRWEVNALFKAIVALLPPTQH